MKKLFTNKFLPTTIAFVFSFLGFTSVSASHLVGADLTYNFISGNTYEITLNMYRDCAGASLGNTATISISSASCGVSTSVTANLVAGFPIEVSAICAPQISQTTCNSGNLPGIQQWQYKVNYTLPQSCTDWTFSYSNCCRNYAISTGPGGNSFYIEAKLNNVIATANSSPDFTSLPVPYMCVNQLMNYNHGAFDINGDSLVYALITPRQAVTTNVTYNAPYSGTYPLATNPAFNFGFNTLTGQMTFTPAMIQQSVCAVKVSEYRNGVLIGSVVRDIQMVVINCNNNSNVSVSPISNLQNATIIGTNNIRVCAGELLSFQLTASDPNAGTVIQVTSNAGTVIPGANFTTVGTNPAVSTFSWQTNSNSIGYWNFTVTVSDNHCPVPSVQVIGFTINVFGVDIAANDYTFCPGIPQTVQLDASVGGSVGCPGGGQCYSWSPPTGLSATNIPNPVATVSGPISYIVTYNDGVCIVNDTVTFVPEGSVTISPSNPVVCSGTGVQLTTTNTFPNNNNACGSAAGTLCNGPNVTRIVGTGVGVSGGQFTSVTPYQGYWHDGRMQMLFTGSELTAAGTLPGRINSMIFNIATKYSTQSFQGFTIKMGCTNLGSLSSFQGGLLQVYTGTVNTFAGLNTYNFTTPYMWDGISNIIVEVCFDNASYTYSDPVYYTATAYTSVLYDYADFSVGCTMNSPLTSTLRPNIRFANCPVAPPINYTWTSIAGDPVSSLNATNIPDPIASPTQTTTYVVAADNGSCTVYDTVTVTMNPLIFLNDILDMTQCPNVPTTLTASGQGLTGYSWNTGQTTASINVSPPITTTYTVTASSACGNLVDNVTIFVVDTIPPVIANCPASVNVNNDAGVCGAVITWQSPTVTDNCVGIVMNQTQGLASGSVFPIGVTTVEYIATDGSGNKDTCSFIVTVQDTELPVINNCPANIAVTNDAGVCGATVAWAAPTVSDNCPNAVIVQTQGTANGGVFALGTTTIEYTATDASGNTAVCTFTVTVTDTEAPVINNCPANIAVTNDAEVCGATVNWAMPSTTDNCSANIVQTLGAASGTLFPLGTSTIEYTSTDPSGNTSVCTFTITVTDTEVPVINGCPANIAVTNDAGVCGATVTWATPTTTDNCSANIVQTLGAASGTVFPLGTSTIEYTATDASGNIAVCIFTIDVSDTESPVIVACPANISVNNDLGVCGATVTWVDPTTTDNCSANIVQTLGAASGTVFPLGTSTIEYTATDPSGNSAICTFTITVTDTELPVIAGCPANIAVNNDLGVCGATVTWIDPTVTDNCPNPVIAQTLGAANGTVFPLGTSTIEYTATDANGNSAICSFIITVTDTENPVIAGCPANIAVTNDIGVCGATVTWVDPTTTDNCSATIAQTQGAASGTVFPLGTSTIEYTATDPSGNTAICTFTITVTDPEAPVINNCPANFVVTNDPGVCGAAVTWTAPTTTDNCSANIVQTLGAANGSVFPLGTSTIEYTATDAAGNTAICTFSITVSDIENPVFVTCPSNISVNNNLGVCGAIVAWAIPIASDNCSANVVQTLGAASGTVFPLGTSTIEYTATDPSGNSAICTFTITVTDTELPVIAGCPANINVTNDIGVCGATITWIDPTVTDNCPNPAIAQTLGVASGTVFPLGTSTIEYTATDANGNSAICSFTITVTDTENPVINGCPANIAVTNDIGVCGATVTWVDPTTTDNCSATIAQTQGAASGTVFPLGTSTIEYTATDPSGNTAICTFTITVTDPEAPVINGCPANIAVNNDLGVCGATVTWVDPTTTDNCSATIAQTLGAASGTVFPLGTSTIEYTATDASGNTAICTFTITVTDTEIPVISGCPANIAVSNDAGACGAIVTWTVPTVSDNCAGTVMVSNFNSGDNFPLGTTVVNYDATDANGNIAVTCSFTITVTDDENPVLSNCPANISLSAAANCQAIANWVNPTLTDNCPGAGMVSNFNSGASFGLGTTTVTYTATDAAGNTANCSFTVTVTDNTAPIIANCPANISQNAGPNCDAIVNWVAPTVSDNCPGVTMTSNFNLGDTFPFTTTTVTYTATDAAGNVSTCSFTVDLFDNTPPVIANCPANIVINLEARCDTTVNWTPPTITDNCSGLVITNTHNPGDVFPLGVTNVNYTGTDAAGNVSTCDFTVTVIAPPAINASITATTDPNCNGQNGSATISVVGGSGSYNYSWNSSPAQNTPTATLTAGSYIGLVTDALAGTCVPFDTVHVTITEPAVLAVTMSKNNLKCFQDNSGNATATVVGGTLPYTYLWSDNQSTPTAINLAAGTYSVLVTDAQGCTKTTSITLTQPDSLAANVSQINVKCFGENTGQAVIGVSGGTNPYSYNWTNGVSTGSIANNLTTGTYTVTVTDVNLCTINRTFVITQPAAPLTLATSVQDATCFGSKTGSATVSPSGGTAGYTYTWNSIPVQYTATATNLPAGPRQVIVRDANNCSTTANVTVGQPTRVNVHIDNITHPYCDNPNGAISVSASGGTSPYTYQWSDGQIGAVSSALLEGDYTVIATDANNCIDSAQVTLTNTPPPVAMFSSAPTNNEPILIQNATIDFTNLSTGAVAYEWSFGDGFTGLLENPSHTYNLPGTYIVMLTAYNAYGMACPDTQRMTFTILPDGSIYIPNVFTPNRDGENDEFFISGTGIKEMKCLIFDRWGKMVYILQSSSDKWTGYNQEGKELPEGTYTYKLEARLNDGNTLERGGTIMLIR